MSRSDVVILDYGFGNIRSAQRALERVGAQVEVTADVARAESCDGLVVPGVGAFGACMGGIDEIDARSTIVNRVQSGRPVLGICVGAQIMFERGVEHGVPVDGLGLLSGEVVRVAADILPHMGWNTVEQPTTSQLYKGIDADARFYFVHSYAAKRAAVGVAAAMCTYGEPFVASCETGSLSTTQFHPEKSGDVGAALLANWMETL